MKRNGSQWTFFCYSYVYQFVLALLKTLFVYRATKMSSKKSTIALFVVYLSLSQPFSFSSQEVAIFFLHMLSRLNFLCQLFLSFIWPNPRMGFLSDIEKGIFFFLLKATAMVVVLCLPWAFRLHTYCFSLDNHHEHEPDDDSIIVYRGRRNVTGVGFFSWQKTPILALVEEIFWGKVCKGAGGGCPQNPKLFFCNNFVRKGGGEVTPLTDKIR